MIQSSSPQITHGKKSISTWCAWSLSLLVLWTAPTYAQSISPSVSVSTPTQQRLDPQTVLKQLAKSKVVYLGETHDEDVEVQGWREKFGS
jgi:uncharacterized iron-regulated protein